MYQDGSPGKYEMATCTGPSSPQAFEGRCSRRVVPVWSSRARQISLEGEMSQDGPDGAIPTGNLLRRGRMVDVVETQTDGVENEFQDPKRSQ